jgi:hypothetical protein
VIRRRQRDRDVTPTDIYLSSDLEMMLPSKSEVRM